MTRLLSSLLTGLLLTFLLASTAGAFPRLPLSNGEPVYGYLQASQQVLRFDAAYDALSKESMPSITTQVQLDAWVTEIVPFFEYEQIDQEGMTIYPSSVSFENYINGTQHNHVLGQTNCLDSAITLNARFTNPISSWYGRVDAVGTLVHELAHAQGICFANDTFDAEVSAQLVTLEILSALVNKGNRAALPALVNELRDMSIASAKYAARAEGREDEFAALMKRVAPDAFDQAIAAKSDRFWQADPERLSYILEAYNFTPMREVYQALATDQAISGVQLPINDQCSYMNNPAYPFPGYADGEQEADCEMKPLVVDDLAYVVANLDALIGAESAG